MYEPKRSFTSSMQDWIPGQFGGGYRYFTGSLAYVLHRITGIALIFYLFFHILSITKATNSPWTYDILMHRYQELDFKFGEIALYGCLLFHGINGIRILLVDFVFDRSHVSQKLFWYFGVLIVGLLIAGAIPLVLHLNTMPLQAGGN